MYNSNEDCLLFSFDFLLFRGNEMSNTSTKLMLAKAANKTKLITMWIFTIGCAIMIAAGVAVAFENPHDIVADLIMALIFVAGAVFGIMRIRKLRIQKAALNNYREYIARLSNDPQKSLANLGKSFNLPTESITVHIRELIKLGLINSAYIENGRLVLPERNLYEKAPETVYVAMKCACCGANSTVPEGKSNICEYCGSPLTK